MTTSKTNRKTAHNNRAPKDRPAGKPTKYPRRNATKKAAEHAVRPGTKQVDLIALLDRPGGATIQQMCAKTSWQAHSVRAALTGLRKRGIAVTRTENAAGASIYRAGPS